MRGFRGSRAAQSLLSSPGGRSGPVQLRVNGSGNPRGVSSPQDSQRPTLPDWLKTPETRAREQAEARALQVQVKAQGQTQHPAVQKSPDLRLIAGPVNAAGPLKAAGPVKAPAAVSEKSLASTPLKKLVTAKKAAPHAKKAASKVKTIVTSARKAEKTKVASKRKPAERGKEVSRKFIHKKAA